MTELETGALESQDRGLRLRMNSEERRLASQHVQLERLRQAVITRIEEDGAIAALETFLRLVAALDAHMLLEEQVYFPALHGLKPGVGPELAELVSDHREVRNAAAEIRKLLWADDRDLARTAFDGFARRIARHESIEENLIARVMGRAPKHPCFFATDACSASSKEHEKAH